MSICILGFVFSLRTPLVFFLNQQSFVLCPRFPQFQHSTESLFLSLLLSLSCPCCSCCPCFPLPLPFPCFACPCLCQMHQCPLLLGVMDLSVSRFVLRDLYTHSMFWFLLSRHHTKSISHGSLHVFSRVHLATKLQGNSCEYLPQYCVHFLEHLVGYSSVSRDLPSSRWHPSTQAISFASATESPSRDFVLVPLCTDSTFRAACANSRSHGHLLLT